MEQEIIAYFKQQYEEAGKTPSVKQIKQKFGLNNKSFYQLFPKGIAELCQQIGIPKPEDRYKRLEKAMKTRNVKRETKKEDPESLDLEDRKTGYSVMIKGIEEKTRLCEQVRTQALKLAKTPEGQQHIFSNSNNMWQFFEDVFRNHNPDVIKEFIMFCEEHDLEEKQTLFQAVSDLERYKLNCKWWPMKLDKYLLDETKCFMHDLVAEKEMKTLQASFSESLLHATCQGCGKPLACVWEMGEVRKIYLGIVIENQLHCSECDAIQHLVCPKCGKELEYKSEGNGFYCVNCDLLLKLSVID